MGNRLRFAAALGACIGVFAPAAFAVDGVIEISQSQAEIGAVTPGDTAGFPVTITVPGSYRLTGDLVVPASTSGIRIDADGVAIDLNGFGIAGPYACCGAGTGSGIEFTPNAGRQATVENGDVSGFALDGVQLGDGARVERVTVSQVGRDGITLGGGSLALANRVREVGQSGLVLGGSTPSGYRDNLVVSANLGGGGTPAFEGARAIGGNVCTDGSCSSTGARRYYLTTTTVAGNAATTACATGFHMASIAEIFDTTQLLYDRSRGYILATDQGSGPPFSIAGWVRTGVPSFTNTVPGNANCSAWTSNNAAHNGTRANLQPQWATASEFFAPWDTTVQACGTTSRVWCVED
jgi:hypothetical protein